MSKYNDLWRALAAVGSEGVLFSAADAVTALRLVAAVGVLCAKPLDVWFYVFYAVGVLSDVADGIVARRFGSSPHGAALDSVCDAVFFSAVFLRLFPLLALPAPYLIVCAVIALWRTANVFLGERPVFLHTALDKCTGVLLAFLPLLVGRIPSDKFAVPLLLLAAAAAADETVQSLKKRK